MHTAQRGHRLSLNENPYGPLPSVRRALTGALGAANRYPEFLPRRLPELIAGRLGYPPEQVVVGAGATGVIMHILQEFVPPGAGVVLATPTFDGYPLLTATVGGRVVEVPLTPTGHQDLPALAAAVDERTAVVVLCSPHNPTGTAIRHAELAEFLEHTARSVVVVFDEAYVDFVRPSERVRTAELLARHPNLIVMRTFSKAYGLAALRVGYALGSVPIMARIRRWQLPFGMTALAEAGVRACYAAEAELAVRTATITRECDRLTTGLRELGYQVPASSANFVYLTGCDALELDRLRGGFAGAGIQVKHCATGIRITVGDTAATEAVIAAAR
ncbi:pyridoxal phosphate-dependent aminotransferase [Nocardia brasiliensis]|uniref:Histidinol-phosphate transaminase n=1 Tax=Nocardia brasiliensis (strain ATCC 700358 / HUJEG-1) TaxID=1133849 RepID=K0EV39_NOCB7|nr:aminotransferase class I/II-fold pyridoxal phosphate-dependent enzyme [Nocardia brasiliensis]AFU01397.1 histidinol-phosphate transaminase [Nocardia brasiliensis ATCC 700358]OCF86736.1 aminotransferase [Nocardia brasiliensis]